MNLVFRDIEIDLIMARLPVERVDKDLDIRFDEILKGVGGDSFDQRTSR